MTRLTKNELVTLNASLAAQLEAARAEVSRLQAQLAAERATRTPAAAHPATKPLRGDVAAMRAAMAIAREEAMRTGRTVKVGG